MIKKIIISILAILTLTCWPVNLYLKNTLPDFVTYFIPAVLLVISYYMYSNTNKYYLTPILMIGIYEKKLLILPIIFFAIEILINFKKEILTFMVASLVLFFWQYSAWRGQSVFNRDYEGEQQILRDIHLYPNIPMARFFQNKPKLYLGKVSVNFFALADLNNYFFAGHPAPTTISTQELYKFYWPLIIFLLLGIYHFNDLVIEDFILISTIACLVSLSVLINFDRNDFILWFPISLIIIHGIKKTFK